MKGLGINIGREIRCIKGFAALSVVLVLFTEMTAVSARSYDVPWNTKELKERNRLSVMGMTVRGNTPVKDGEITYIRWRVEELCREYWTAPLPVDPPPSPTALLAWHEHPDQQPCNSEELYLGQGNTFDDITDYHRPDIKAVRALAICGRVLPDGNVGFPPRPEIRVPIQASPATGPCLPRALAPRRPPAAGSCLPWMLPRAPGWSSSPVNGVHGGLTPRLPRASAIEFPEMNK